MAAQQPRLTLCKIPGCGEAPKIRRELVSQALRALACAWRHRAQSAALTRLKPYSDNLAINRPPSRALTFWGVKQLFVPSPATLLEHKRIDRKIVVATLHRLLKCWWNWEPFFTTLSLQVVQNHLSSQATFVRHKKTNEVSDVRMLFPMYLARFFTLIFGEGLLKPVVVIGHHFLDLVYLPRTGVIRVRLLGFSFVPADRPAHTRRSQLGPAFLIRAL